LNHAKVITNLKRAAGPGRPPQKIQPTRAALTERGTTMDPSDFVDGEEETEDDDDRGELEQTDIDSDELLDGEVDADGASAIPHRNE
jgi:hypothetical protein